MAGRKKGTKNRRDPWVVTDWTDAQKARAARLVRAGRKPEDVAAVYETDVKTLRRWTRRYGS